MGPTTSGTIKGVAAAAVVIPEVVIQMEWLSTLESHNAVQTPTVLQLLHASAAIGEVVGEIPGEAMRDVEVRRAIFQARASAVVGLGRVGLEIFAVAGVVKRLRPNIVRRSKSRRAIR